MRTFKTKTDNQPASPSSGFFFPPRKDFVQRQSEPTSQPTSAPSTLSHLLPFPFDEAAYNKIRDKFVAAIYSYDAYTFMTLLDQNKLERFFFEMDPDFQDLLKKTFKGKLLFVVYLQLLWGKNYPEIIYRLIKAVESKDAALTIKLLQIIYSLNIIDLSFLQGFLEESFSGKNSELVSNELKYPEDAPAPVFTKTTFNEITYAQDKQGNYFLKQSTGRVNFQSYKAGNELRIVIFIRLMDGDHPGKVFELSPKQNDTFTNAIESHWNNKFALTNGAEELNVKFLPYFNDPDYNDFEVDLVNAKSTATCKDTGITSEHCWHLNDKDDSIAHEFGHMIGAHDEQQLPAVASDIPPNLQSVLTPEELKATTYEGVTGETKPSAPGGYSTTTLMGYGKEPEPRHLSVILSEFNSHLSKGTPPYVVKKK